MLLGSTNVVIDIFSCGHFALSHLCFQHVIFCSFLTFLFVHALITLWSLSRQMRRNTHYFVVIFTSGALKSFYHVIICLCTEWFSG